MKNNRVLNNKLLQNLLRVCIVSTLIFFLSSCAVGPVSGIIFSNTKFAGEYNAKNDVEVNKTGEGCQHMFLWMVAVGDAGAGFVAFENGIKRIATIDHSAFNILMGAYSRYCTIVSGSSNTVINIDSGKDNGAGGGGQTSPEIKVGKVEGGK